MSHRGQAPDILAHTRDLHRLSPSPRLRGEGRGEGLFFEFGQKRLENPVQILNDIARRNDRARSARF